MSTETRPVPVKCAGAYRAVLEHLIGQFNHMLFQNPVLTKYFVSIDAAPSNNLARYYRLPGSHSTEPSPSKDDEKPENENGGNPGNNNKDKNVGQAMLKGTTAEP